MQTHSNRETAHRAMMNSLYTCSSNSAASKGIIRNIFFFMVFLPSFIYLCHFARCIIFSLILLTWRCRRVECACAQTLLGILITMLQSWGVSGLLELSGLLFQGATHYITIPKIRLLEGIHKAMEEGALFLTPCTPLCFCRPTGSILFCDGQSLKKERGLQ